MAKVIVALSMSLDGFITGANDGVGQPLGAGGEALFRWYFDGDTPSRHYEAAANRGVPVPPFRLSRTSAGVFDGLIETGGAVVTGRRTYDITHGWGGHGPVPGLPLFVLTHQVPEEVPDGEIPYTFVTDGVESAIAQAKAAAGDRYVSVMGASIPQQCLRLGLLDEIQIHLAPVLLGAGLRLFDHLGAEGAEGAEGTGGTGGIELEAVRVVEAPGVTHLRYRVVR
jgi:dihydrofolate reductase